jgi:tRNA(Ile2) C34 agmatinyltransferase TiaS
MDIENLEYLNNGKVDQNQIDNYELNDEFIDNSYAEQNCDDVLFGVSSSSVENDDVNDDLIYKAEIENNDTAETNKDVVVQLKDIDNIVEAENDENVKQQNKRGRPKASIKGHKIYNLSCRNIKDDNYVVIEAFESLQAIA